MTEEDDDGPEDDGPEPRARRTDPDTSHEAAEAMGGLKVTRERQRVLDAMEAIERERSDGVTSLEVADYIEKHLQKDSTYVWTASPRFVELEKMGLVERMGKARRSNSRGNLRSQGIWRLKREPEPVEVEVEPDDEPPAAPMRLW